MGYPGQAVMPRARADGTRFLALVLALADGASGQGEEVIVAHRTLIVARMNPADAAAVAGIFAESDATELPLLLGASRRTLFRFHDLYLHLIEADRDFTGDLYQARGHPLFRDVNTKLGHYVQPYDPGWREPKDAMAEPFYKWSAAIGAAETTESKGETVP
jgi:cyclase